MIRRVVFDLYGTLLHIEGQVERVSRHVPDAAAFVDAWRQKQINYTWTSSLMQRYRDFDDLTAAAFDYVAAARNVEVDESTRAELLDGWQHLKPHPEVPAVLQTLRERNIDSVIFTNGVKPTVERTLAHAGLAAHFAHVLTVEPARAFKPAVAVYQIVCDTFAVEPNEVMFVSSNGWDAAGAAAFGFTVVWCNRGGAPLEGVGVAPKHVVGSLEALPQLLSPGQLS